MPEAVTEKVADCPTDTDNEAAHDRIMEVCVCVFLAGSSWEKQSMVRADERNARRQQLLACR